MLKDIEKRVLRAIQEQVFPGCVVGIVSASGKRIVLPFGRFTYEHSSREVAEDTVYDLASVTKSLPLSSLALTLIEEKRLGLADKVATYIPELRNDYGATVEDLLTYRVQGPQLSTLKDKTPDEILAHAFESGFKAPPGPSLYTNFPALLLGVIVERVGGDSFDRLARANIFNPLGMKWTGFFPADTTSIPPTEIDEWRGQVQGLPHDESAYAFARENRAAGHAGLFSRADDLLHFFEALLCGDLRFVVRGGEKGLGWQANDPRFMGAHATEHTFGKTGFTGTSCVIDTKRGIAFVILSNRTYPKRPESDKAIYQVRADIADIIFSPT